ncbi:hypothetical protein CkaCkLH20_03973 [Colletotrichum karsti]|uniref:Uncharacterized protein n=1 Tax=Colletotrichum karsti TaxID=1095194 RepID=A0A9P6IDD0_9PEZI|nr:uncharacterized protein CkaCkLH20_03973 [Colletotrichum karsti]KAF9878481.1 hypothetical protein CkaCkLH20_03973 [Colletotrichum karsti]
MSSYYSFQHQAHPTPAVPGASHNHHGGRNRRQPRLSVSQNAHKQFRGVRSMKELTETASINAFRTKFEAGRSFDLEDDMEFCPGLLTDSDMNSIHSSSERSSLASNSPESSPTQQPQQVATFNLNSASPAFIPPAYQHTAMKIHQPSATRARNAIPIVNPATGIQMSSPPPSVSPARMQQGMRRW